MNPTTTARRHLPAVLGAAAGLLLAAPTLAAHNEDAKILIHLVPDHSVKLLNCFNHGVTEYKDVVVHGELSPDPEQPRGYLAYVLVAGFEEEYGIAGLQFGIAYDGEPGSGIDIDSWQDCALYEWHREDWPLPGTGNLLTWNQDTDCQNKTPIVVGFFHLIAYSADKFAIIPRPVDGKNVLAACGVTGSNYQEYSVNVKRENLGYVGFGETEGYNPWDPKQNRLEIRKSFDPIKN